MTPEGCQLASALVTERSLENRDVQGLICISAIVTQSPKVGMRQVHLHEPSKQRVVSEKQLSPKIHFPDLRGFLDRHDQRENLPLAQARKFRSSSLGADQLAAPLGYCAIPESRPDSR